MTNDIKISAGLFTSDRNKNFWGQTWEVVSRFTKQLPQTVVGNVYSTFSNYAWQVDKVDYNHGATVVMGNNWGNEGAATIGSYITGHSGDLEANDDNHTFQHEYGHYLQSQAVGWDYLFDYAIPSLRDAMHTDSQLEHNKFWVEQDANKRSIQYFEKNYPGFVDVDHRWDFTHFPITGYDQSKSFADNYYVFHPYRGGGSNSYMLYYPQSWGSVPYMFSNYDPAQDDDQQSKTKKPSSSKIAAARSTIVR